MFLCLVFENILPLSLVVAQQNYSLVIKSAETKECLLLQSSLTMWDCQVTFKGQMTLLVKRPRTAYGDILNRAARNVSQYRTK